MRHVSDNAVTPLYLVFCLILIGTAHWRVWVRTLPASAEGRRSRAATLLAVAGWQLAGLLVPAGLLAGLIGLEEVIKTPLVPERIALGAFGLTALQLIAGLGVFFAAVWRTRAR
jgi:hypothetical protein